MNIEYGFGKCMEALNSEKKMSTLLSFIGCMKIGLQNKLTWGTSTIRWMSWSKRSIDWL